MALLSGPRLASAKGEASHLVVLLHGYGADGDDLIGLAPHWQDFVPGAAFVAPNAPERVPGAPSGFQWFPISRIDPHEMQKGIALAAPRIEQFLDTELAELGLPLVIVTGSYLGTISHTLTALDVLARRDLRVAGLVVNESPTDIPLAETMAVLARFAPDVPMAGLARHKREVDGAAEFAGLWRMISGSGD